MFAPELFRICSPAWSTSKVVCCLGVCDGMLPICWALKTVYTRWMNRDFSAPALLPLPVFASPLPSDGDDCVLSQASFASQYSICVPFSPRRTCHPLSAACLYVIHLGSSYPRCRPVAIK